MVLWGYPQLYQRRLRRYFTHFRWRLGRRGSIAGTNYEFNVFDVLFCVLFFFFYLWPKCHLRIAYQRGASGGTVTSLGSALPFPFESLFLTLKRTKVLIPLTELRAGMEAKGRFAFDFRDSDTECQLDKHCENPPDSEIGVDKYQLRFETTYFDDGYDCERHESLNMAYASSELPGWRLTALLSN